MILCICNNVRKGDKARYHLIGTNCGVCTRNMIEITDEAITQLLKKQTEEGWANIRLGITGGGCAGFEYIFDSINDAGNSDDVFLDHGKFGIVIDKLSIPYLVGMTLDYRKEGLNEVFKFINPKEEASCGCGVSINFDLEKVKIDENKIFAVDLS